MENRTTRGQNQKTERTGRHNQGTKGLGDRTWRTKDPKDRTWRAKVEKPAKELKDGKDQSTREPAEPTNTG